MFGWRIRSRCWLLKFKTFSGLTGIRRTVNDNQMLTIDQAAEQLNVSARTVRNPIVSGKLAHHRIGAGRGVIRISEEALNQLLAECEVRSSDAPTSPRRRERRQLRHIKL
jgi:excisionase family DNA binding protein